MNLPPYRVIPPSPHTIGLAQAALEELEQKVKSEYARHTQLIGQSFGAKSPSFTPEELEKNAELQRRSLEMPKPLVPMGYPSRFAWSDKMWFHFLFESVQKYRDQVSWFASEHWTKEIVLKSQRDTRNIRGMFALLIAGYYNVNDNFFLQLYLKMDDLATQTRQSDGKDPRPDFDERDCLNANATNYTLRLHLEIVLILRKFCGTSCPEYVQRVIFACRWRVKGMPDIPV